LPPTLADDEREALAREIIAPYLDLALRKGNDRDKFWALYASPIFDPIETFDRLSEVTFRRSGGTSACTGAVDPRMDRSANRQPIG